MIFKKEGVSLTDEQREAFLESVVKVVIPTYYDRLKDGFKIIQLYRFYTNKKGERYNTHCAEVKSTKTNLTVRFEYCCQALSRLVDQPVYLDEAPSTPSDVLSALQDKGYAITDDMVDLDDTITQEGEKGYFRLKANPRNYLVSGGAFVEWGMKVFYKDSVSPFPIKADDYRIPANEGIGVRGLDDVSGGDDEGDNRNSDNNDDGRAGSGAVVDDETTDEDTNVIRSTEDGRVHSLESGGAVAVEDDS